MKRRDITTPALIIPRPVTTRYNTKKNARVRARQHTVVIPNRFSWPRTDPDALFVEVVVAAVPDAVGGPAVRSDAWWINVNMSLSATPTNEDASEAAILVVLVTSGYVPVAVTVIRSPVIVSPAIVYVPNMAVSIGSVNIATQPVLGVYTEFGSVE